MNGSASKDQCCAPRVDRRAFLALTGAAATALPALATIGAEASAKPAAAVVPTVFPPPALPQGTQEGFVQVEGGGRIGYVDTGGNGPAVVLLHAATGSLRSWPYQLSALKAAGFRTIAYSRAGILPSDPAGKAPPPREIDALIETLGLGRIHLLGTAAGGMVALDYALEKPARLHSLTLACSGMATDHPIIAEGWKRLLPRGFSQMPADFRELSPSYRAANPEGVAAWLEINRSSRPPRPQPAESAAPAPEGSRPTARSDRADGGSLATALGRSRPEPAFEALARTRLPLLLMTGDCDLYMPPALLRQVARLLPEARMEVIQDAGHSAYWEQPEAFNRALIGFLRGQAAKG
jgi:pimeloyl-ACP methyl ester carboxylesterase